MHWLRQNLRRKGAKTQRRSDSKTSGGPRRADGDAIAIVMTTRWLVVFGLLSFASLRLCVEGLVGVDHLGPIRIAPSSRMVSPFNICASAMYLTIAANSSGLPSREGNGTCLPSDSCTSGGSPFS